MTEPNQPVPGVPETSPGPGAGESVPLQIPESQPDSSSPADVPADEADYVGSEAAHLVALPTPESGPPQQVAVPATRAPRPEDELPIPPSGATPADTSAFADELLNGLMPLAAREANIFSLCYDAAKQVVIHQAASEMRDAVTIGEAMFQPGIRTPLETAVPQIAIEIYKNVRQEMRDQKKPKPGKKKPC